MIRLQMSFTYLASAIAKTQDPDWISGNVLKGRINYMFRKNNMGNENMPFELSDYLANILKDGFCFIHRYSIGSGSRVFPGIGTLDPDKPGNCALWIGVIFHGSIEFSSFVLVFSYASLATYFVVINPTTRDQEILF